MLKSLWVGSHSLRCLDKGDSSVKCWGNGGNDGRLGNGATTTQSSPVDVHTSSDNSDTLSDIAASVSAGRCQHNCALTLDSTVKCWGDGDSKDNWAMGQRIVAPIASGCFGSKKVDIIGTLKFINLRFLLLNNYESEFMAKRGYGLRHQSPPPASFFKLKSTSMP